MILVFSGLINIFLDLGALKTWQKLTTAIQAEFWGHQLDFQEQKLAGFQETSWQTVNFLFNFPSLAMYPCNSKVIKKLLISEVPNTSWTFFKLLVFTESLREWLKGLQERIHIKLFLLKLPSSYAPPSLSHASLIQPSTLLTDWPKNFWSQVN